MILDFLSEFNIRGQCLFREKRWAFLPFMPLDEHALAILNFKSFIAGIHIFLKSLFPHT